MYLLHSTITLLVVIAHAQCGTLRQYGPDWLIPKPAPHVDSKRITAKSVFIAPTFQGQNVRCATGFREDGSGRCVKLVHVNQAAQLDFLLQRLNAMYGDAPGGNHSEKQPLQVTVEIPVELPDGNDTSMPLKGEEMYSEAILPEGEVSVDLLAGTVNEPDTTTEENNSTEENQTETDEESGFPDSGNESEDNGSDVGVTPNKEWFQVDEDPLVTLTSIDDEDEEDSVDSTTVTPGNEVGSVEGELPDTLLSVNSEDLGAMANVMKNNSNMVKKETLLGDGAVSATSGFTTNHTFTTDNKTESVSHNSNHSVNKIPSQFTVNDVDGESTEDESINEVHVKSPNVANTTSSKVDTTGQSSGVTSSVQESTTVVPTTEVETTTETSTTNFTTRETTITLESTTQEVSTGVPTFATDEGYGVPTEQSVNETRYPVGEHSWEESGEQAQNEQPGANNEDDYDYPIRDVDVEAELPADYVSEVTAGGNVDFGLDKGGTRYPEAVPEGSADEGLVLGVNDSVKTNSTVVGDDELFSEDTHGDLGENGVSVNSNASLNSTKPIIELDGGVHVSSSSGTHRDELVTQRTETSVDKLSEDSSSNASEHSVVKQGDSDVQKADSTIHNVEIQPYEFTEIVHSVTQEMQHQPVFTPQHSVHVVYPHPPIIQVMNAEQEPHMYPVNVPEQHQSNIGHKDNINQHQSKIGHKDNINQHQSNIGHTDNINQHQPNIGHKQNINPNSPHVQIHNLNPIPNPLQHHNVDPLMPLMEKAPVIPPIGDYIYPPLPPQSEVPRPNHHPHHRPYQQHNPRPHHNPHHHTRYPQNHPNSQGQGGGFVRFPGESVVKTHHHRPHDTEVNTVRFPQEDTRNNDKYSRWGNWRGVEGRGQQHQNQWAGTQDTQYPQGTNRRNYWVDNRPNRRRPQPSSYY